MLWKTLTLCVIGIFSRRYGVMASHLSKRYALLVLFQQYGVIEHHFFKCVFQKSVKVMGASKAALWRYEVPPIIGLRSMETYGSSNISYTSLVQKRPKCPENIQKIPSHTVIPKIPRLIWMHRRPYMLKYRYIWVCSGYFLARMHYIWTNISYLDQVFFLIAVFFVLGTISFFSLVLGWVRKGLVVKRGSRDEQFENLLMMDLRWREMKVIILSEEGASVKYT